MRSLLRTLALSAVLVAAPPLHAQPGAEAPSGEPGRAHLQRLLAARTEASLDPSLSRDERALAAREAASLGARLRDGDLRPGDQLEVTVEGEAQLSGTFTVSGERELVLPGMAPVPLGGVLRAELEDHLRGHVARYVRDPAVRARAMIRIAVLGQVSEPGFYAVPAEATVADLIMAAGGPLPVSHLAGARIERAGERVWEGQSLREAVRQGRSLDQMSLRSGDELFVPERPASRSSTVLRLATALPAAVLAVIGLARLF